MSNRIDFYQSEQTGLALPASTVSVLVDGMACPWLEVIEIARSGWPDFSWARLAYNPAVYPQDQAIPIERIETRIAAGASICIQRVYNNMAPGSAACGFAVFVGRVESIETRIGPDGERAEIIARDLSADLERVTVYGRRVRKSDGSTLFLAGADTVFNDNSKPNAATEVIEYEGDTFTVFCTKLSQAKLFSYAEVIDYLLCEYLPPGQAQKPSLEQLRGLTCDQMVRDLDVTGLNLLQALDRCCDRIGLKFKFVPRPVPTGPNQAIVFYRDGVARSVELDCQPTGQRLSISKTNISSLQSRKNFWPVTHKYIGQGDFKIYEATFDLVKAWDPALESTNYDEFSPSTNPDFYKVKDVYRKWCLNEAGDYTDAPYNQGQAFDFSKVFETSNYVQHRRRFWPTLTADKQAKSLGYYLQVSFNNGSTWLQYLYAFNNELNECGVWLSSDHLDFNTWAAALNGTLKFRITASVVSDQRLSCELADGPVDSTAPVVEHLIILPRQFKYRKVASQSIFAQSDDDTLDTPDEVDDMTVLYEYVRQQVNCSSEIAETIDIKMPALMFDYEVGDRVTSSPESPDVLACRSDNRSLHWIDRLQLNFENQTTNLKIIRQRGRQL